MRSLLKAIAIVGCVTGASAAQAVPLFYDEADSGDIFARVGAIPVFNFGVGNNVIAGSQFLSGPDFAMADLDVFSFVVPQDSVLSFVTVEFGAFEFTGPLVGFGPNYSIRRGALTGPTQGVDTSRTDTNPFTDVLTSIGPQNLFTRLPIESGLYSWIDGLGNRSLGLSVTSAQWDYGLTFGSRASPSRNRLRSRCWASACSRFSSQGQAHVLTADSRATCSRSSHRRQTCTRESRGATAADAARGRAADN
jgi:hypothetical protein